MSEVISFWLRRHTPHFLGVGLEEVAVQPGPEPGDQPTLVVGLIFGGPHPGPHVRQHATDGLDDAQVAKGVHALEGIVVKLAVVIDAAHPGTKQKIFRSEDLVPQCLDRLHLGKKPVTTDIEPPSVPFGAAANTANHAVAFQHGCRPTGLGQLVGGRQARRTSSDNDHVVSLI
jgi:hypothetical protein